ncbi:MAG: phosphotransferase family protein [Acidimicrobiia bacterium]|nr:phosphotransferase family protein [Acidimicrobiia bacterium]MYC46172.1 phosphotransferase family protein [Acidimicrobiia bacterium]MYI18685.1 phosphotransferase family protein [Acidimicrobiia bacterium]
MCPGAGPRRPRPRNLVIPALHFVIPAKAGIQRPDKVLCLPAVRAAVSVGRVVVPDLCPEAVGSALLEAGVAPRCVGNALPEVVRLDGGYSWITLLVRWDTDDAVIVRVAPMGGTVEPYEPAAEARRLRAVAGVVPAPEVLAVCDEPNPIGRPFGVHTPVTGEAQRRPADPAPYREALAAALGALHSRADPRALDEVATIGAAYEAELARQADVYRRCWRHPGIDVAMRWLAHHRPACRDAPALCHGDFRPANVLWTAPGVIGGIIDWERAWVGDPLCDVAFSMHLGGWGAIEGEAITPYRAAGGVEIDVDRLRYALRFERVRSILSGMQGLAALAVGRADDPRLADIGAAAQAGAWELADWLEADLPPLGDLLDPPEASYPGNAEMPGLPQVRWRDL